jgi:hypothetical protein
MHRALHWSYYILTPDRHLKCRQNHTSMSTCHPISNTLSRSSHNLRITTVASPSSPHWSFWRMISHWWVYTCWLNVHHIHPGPVQAEHQSQDQEHNKAIGTCVWTNLHAHLCRTSLPYPIHRRLYTLHLCFGPPRSDVEDLHLSLPYRCKRLRKTCDIY